jgi:hypothetical protein
MVLQAQRIRHGVSDRAFQAEGRRQTVAGGLASWQAAVAEAEKRQAAAARHVRRKSLSLPGIRLRCLFRRLMGQHQVIFLAHRHFKGAVASY